MKVEMTLHCSDTSFTKVEMTFHCSDTSFTHGMEACVCNT
jgi:hypothetical protein